MAGTPIAFHDHVVGVVKGLRACADGWSELQELGVPENDLGFVVSDGELCRAGAPAVDPRAAKIVTIDGRYILLLPVDAGLADGVMLLASKIYPADVITSGGRAFMGGLFSAREGQALARAIQKAGASIWVRSRTPDEAGRAATVLLRISAERVRTFSRPAAFSPPEA